MSESLINILLWITYILLIGALVLAVVMSLMNIVKNPKKGKNSLIGIGAMLVLWLVCLMFSSSDVAEKYQAIVSPGQSKWIGAGLIATYLIFIGSLGLVLFTEVKRAFSK
ncbi:MAG TPA: hypothetical protein PKH65_00490 [Bacteroidia bacterium]|nr:hypothetical protein [Bacteroidia bacterium]HNT79129.1 hypothetical protein [Bacteroidia bacterium]